MSLLKDLFRQVVDLCSDDEEETSFHGTVSPDPLFLASEDASYLDRAITAEGVEEGAILARLVKRNCEQRQQIKEAFQQAYGKALDADLGTALSGDVKDLALALLKTPAQYDAQMLREAMKGFGTNEDVLIEILVSRSNAEIAEIKKVYQEEYQRDLEEDIDSENRGHFQDALLALCKGSRSEETKANKDLADIDAKALYDAGEDKTGTNDTLFVHIFTTRSNAQLRRIFQRYSKHSDSEMTEALDFEMSGDIENCLISIAKCAVNKAAYFAEKLHQAMEGYGTRTETLIRVLVTRSEKDLELVEKEYKKLYKKPLQQDILAESGGDLETALLALCGSDD